MENPTSNHLSSAKHALLCLKGISERKLIFRKSATGANLQGYCDADWGSSVDRNSITGYVFKLSEGSSAVSWKSRKQASVALKPNI